MAPRPKNPPPDRRKEILEAALHIFAEKGYNATTNADIARAAGVTPAALYYYFPSKEDLFRAALSDRAGRVKPMFEGMTTDLMARDPKEVLTTFLRTYLAFLSEERTQAVLRIVMAEGPRDPKIARIWEAQVADGVASLFPYLQHQIQQGKIPPMDPRLFFLTLNGPVMATVIVRDLLKLPFVQDLSNDTLVEHLSRTILKSLLADPHPTT